MVEGIGPVEILVILFMGIFLIIWYWSIAEMCKKAGEPWWKGVIPVYNIYVLLEIAQIPGWLMILFFIPIINSIFALYFVYRLSKIFGYGIPFLLVLVLFPYIGFIWLGFGPSKYKGPQQPTGMSSTGANKERKEGPPSHICESCGEKYYSNRTVEINECRKCGGVNVVRNSGK
jgi:hypothetical protein